MRCGPGAVQSQLDTRVFALDTAAAPDDTDPNGANNGLFVRAFNIAESKRIDLQGPIFHDLFDVSRYLINKVDVKIKMYRNSNIFCLLTGDSTEYRVVIEDIYVLVKKN